MPAKAKAVSDRLKSFANAERAKLSARYFKTGPGGYGEGDVFIGLTVPETRRVAKEFNDLSLSEAEKLLHSKIHEERLVALHILVGQFKKADETHQKAIVEFYLKNTAHINNWDLVDTSAPYILGPYLWKRPKDLLTRLAHSPVLWERRIAMLSSFYFIRQGSEKEALEIATLLLTDKEDLMHKAIGWMLREVGKNCGRDLLMKFLKKHYSDLSRTTLRYAIEKFPETERKAWLKGPQISTIN